MPLEAEQQELLLGRGIGLPAPMDTCRGVGSRECTE